MADQTVSIDRDTPAYHRAQVARNFAPALSCHYDRVPAGLRVRYVPSGRFVLGAIAHEPGAGRAIPEYMLICYLVAVERPHYSDRTWDCSPTLARMTRTGMAADEALTVLAGFSAWLRTDEALDAIAAPVYQA